MIYFQIQRGALYMWHEVKAWHNMFKIPEAQMAYTDTKAREYIYIPGTLQSGQERKMSASL